MSGSTTPRLIDDTHKARWISKLTDENLQTLTAYDWEAEEIYAILYDPPTFEQRPGITYPHPAIFYRATKDDFEEAYRVPWKEGAMEI
jgi:hypothetical protein